MAEHNKELLKVVDSFRGTKMLVVGDLILDHYVWGKVSRISPEAPVVVVQVSDESKRLGGAANVAHNLTTLGADVQLCGIVGDDEHGRELVRLLQELGVETSGILVDSSRPTTVKSRVIAHAQQVVRVDREVTRPLTSALSTQLAATVKAKAAASRGIIISDYAKGVVSADLFNSIGEAHREGKIGLDSAALLIDPKAPNFPLYSYASVIKPNRGEAEAASGLEIRDRASAIEAGKVLLGKWSSEMVLITLGEHGMVLVARDGKEGFRTVEVETVAREVYDVSGAGDTVSAVFSLALAAKTGLREAATLANIAAGIVVREIGTAAVSVDELREQINHPGGE